MKKTLLFIAFIAVSLVAHATVYNFGTTTGGITAGQISVVNLTAEATVTDSTAFAYDYTTATTPPLATLSISTMPNFVFSFTNSSTKAPIYKIFPYALYTSGKNVVLTISNVTIGDSIVITTQSKGATGSIWTVTGATTSSNLNIVPAPAAPAVNPISFVRVLATATTVVLKETNGGYRLLSLNWFNSTTSVKQVLADKGISFNGTEILNTKGLAIEVYSMLGKRVATSMTSIRTANFQKGIYVVRVAGSNAALKICI